MDERTAELKVTISFALEKKLKRLQDLLSQKTKKPVSLAQTLEAMTDELLKKHDPVQKAERCLDTLKKVDDGLGVRKTVESDLGVCKTVDDGLGVRKKTDDGLGVRKMKKPLQERMPFIAQIKHAVNYRDQGQCAFILPNNTRCESRRWLSFHHLKPVSQGGLNTLENLQTLCYQHHQYYHRKGCIEKVG